MNLFRILGDLRYLVPIERLDCVQYYHRRMDQLVRMDIFWSRRNWREYYTFQV